ncbi:MaoC family dehydratase N-terminal domain-containing protein [Dactylosporangium roseum]|uniref:MaoC family dehydratase N-terminal domain-containing protein n=1 Tax=Dactylosporangium roseum TaxID=47989 RepID=A0ABY5YYH2_9ACTN|nr:MaoC family dehydratase N-terminal domain-containing protein [Dactylosporangium roseum]UWZ34441.1 MaoC family dehydratase N-terminal domain-containing protein [Dactylosporangium roseum]
MSERDESLDKRIASYVGAPLGPVRRARWAVNESMIGHWADAMEDRNPVYTDSDLAAQSVYGGIIAPPTMLQAWTMPGLQPRVQDLEVEIKAFLAEHGYRGVVATNCEQEYFAPLRPGDHVTAEGLVEDISAEKKTALGPARFLTTLYRYRTDDGTLAATHRFRILCYRPTAKTS